VSRPPFLIPTADLARHPGARQRIVTAGPLADVSLSSARLSGDDVTVDVTVESQGETVTVTGTARGRWAGECRRCLGTTGGEMEVQVSEVFEPQAVEGETYPLGRDALDLEPLLRDAFALALPLAPLCDETCAGPDPEAHPVRTEDAEPASDPRWSALDTLRFE
jgi:uncharacterized protein